MKSTLEELNKEMCKYKVRQNEKQYTRRKNIRILDLTAYQRRSLYTVDGEKKGGKVMKHVHNKLLSLIFRVVKERGQLHTIPNTEAVLETGHTLTAKEFSLS